jgi:hypothetical protein
MDIFWRWFEAADAFITPGQLQNIPHAMRSWMEAAELLRPTTAAERVSCPNCEEHHVEEVERCDGPQGMVRYFIYCPQSLRVQVSPAMLEQWVLDVDAVAALVTASLSLRGKLTTLWPERLWRLGKTDVGDSTREIMLARGLHWEDRSVVAGRITSAGKPIVLVGTESALQHLLGTAVIPMSAIATPIGHGLELDLRHLWTMVRNADGRRTIARELAEDDLDRRVEQAVSRVTRTRLDDDVLIGAHRQFHSLDKAVRALRDAGHEVNRDQIYRAIKRAGGLRAVRDINSSHSVQRTVASQHRNRGKKKSPEY